MINRNDVLPTIVRTMESYSPLMAVLGSADRIFLATAQLPAVFPGIGIHYRETGSKRRAGYNTNKTRDCKGEFEVIIQTSTTLEEMTAIAKLIDEALLAGVPETRAWVRTYDNNNSAQDERIMGISHVGQFIYQFEYTVIDP